MARRIQKSKKQNPGTMNEKREQIPQKKKYIDSGKKITQALDKNREKKMIRTFTELENEKIELEKKVKKFQEQKKKFTEAKKLYKKIIGVTENEERLKAAIDGSGLGLWDWNKKTNKVFYSPRWKEILGYKEEELGDSIDEWFNRIHSSDLEKCLLDLEEHFKGKTEFFSNVHRIQCKNGEYKWVFVRGKVISFEGEELSPRIIGTFSDISERMMTLDALQASEKRYKTITEQLTDYFYTVFFSSGVPVRTMHSRACEIVTGYSKEEIEANPHLWIEMVLPEDRQMVIERFETLKLGHEINPIEHRIVKKDGSVRWVSDTTILHFNQDGELEFYDGVIKDITEKKNAEELLKESERKFREIFNASHEAIFIQDFNSNKILEVNDSMLRMYGFDSVAEIVNRTIEDISSNIYPYSINEANTFLKKVRDGNEQVVEWYARKKNGTYFWVEASLKSTDIGGKKYIIAVIRDINERKIAEDVVKKSENLLRSVWENSIDGMRLTDKEGKIYMVNEAFCKMVDKPKHELEGRFISEIYCQADGQRILDAYLKNYSSGELQPNLERKFTLWNGRQVWFAISVSAVEYDSQDKLVISVFRDISERKIAEEYLHELKEEFKATLYSIGDAVISTDTNGLIKQMNLEAEKLTGWSEIEAIEKPLSQVFKIVDEMTRESVGTLVSNVIQSGLVKGFANYALLICKDGSEKPISSSGAPIKDQRGNITGVVLVFRDQTVERKNRRKIEESEAALKQSQLVAMLGHYDFDILGGKWTNSESLDKVFGIDSSYDKTINGWMDIIHPEDKEEMFSYLVEHVIKNKNPFDKEYRIIRVSDKAIRWVHGKGNLVLDELGNPIVLFGTIQDITQRKNAELMRGEIEGRYKQLVTSMEQGLALHKMIYDENGNPLDYIFLDVNDSYEKQTGLMRNNIIGKRVKEVLPQVEKYWIDTFGEVALTGKPTHYENYVKELDKYYEVTAFSPFKDQFAVIVDEITVRKRAEIEKEITIRMLAILNSQDNLQLMLHEVSKLIQDWIDCEAIGIRFISGNDYTYIATRGFTDGFVKEENSLCKTIIQDSNLINAGNNLSLNCFCGAVIRGDLRCSVTESSTGKSFWTNSGADLVSQIPKDEIPQNFRGRCIAEGYESIALIKLKIGEKVLGLIQLNDKRKGIFTPVKIEILEALSNNLAIALAHKIAQEELKESEFKFRTMFETMVQGVIYQDREGKIISANTAAEKILGRSKDELNALNSFDETWHSIKEDGSIFPPQEHPSMVAINSGGEVRNIVMGVYNPKEAQHRWININAIPQFKEGELFPYQVMVTFEDITKSKLASEALKVSEEKFSTAFRTSPDAININRLKDGMFLDINEGFTNLTGFSEEDIKGKTSLDIDIWTNKKDRETLVSNLLKNGQMNSLEAEFRFKNGAIKTGLMSARIIEIEGEKYILSITRDITERKLAEEKIRLSLKEKEILLKEIHHRVKNNLQVIISLLNLQEGLISNEEIKNIFTDVRTRIRSMALIHELMYRSGNFTAIDVKDYVENLVSSLHRTYVDNLSRINVIINVDPVKLNMDTIIPCGLIINELFSNSLKYAFPGGRYGKIEIYLKASENLLTLEISDDGIGLPKSIDIGNLKSLGLHLVEILVQQILGNLEIFQLDPGTKFRITFKRDN